MKFRRLLRSLGRLLALCAVAAIVIPSAGASGPPLMPTDFAQIAQQGFGDRHNSIAWSMAWFKGSLYVGTGRAVQCVQRAILIFRHPWLKDWPIDPDIECTEDPYELPLQAEIWRWTPAIGAWDRVFQSPKDAPVPGQPGKLVARDI